jgi:hypothetical protein
MLLKCNHCSTSVVYNENVILSTKSLAQGISYHYNIYMSGMRSLVSIVTQYGLDGPGIKCQRGPGFLHHSRPALGPTQPIYNWYQIIPRGKAAGTWH